MIKTIPLNKLVASPRNVRRHCDAIADADAEDGQAGRDQQPPAEGEVAQHRGRFWETQSGQQAHCYAAPRTSARARNPALPTRRRPDRN